MSGHKCVMLLLLLLRLPSWCGVHNKPWVNLVFDFADALACSFGVVLACSFGVVLARSFVVVLAFSVAVVSLKPPSSDKFRAKKTTKSRCPRNGPTYTARYKYYRYRFKGFR